MYAGFYFGTKSATWLGTHQKFNRNAYRSLRRHFNNRLNSVEAGKEFSRFPLLKLIQHFEGDLGPDSLKSRSPSQGEPWHYFDPFNYDDKQIFDIMNSHIEELARTLNDADAVKPAFEASWLAHAITDGLTPAHHYPYEQELERIRGEGKETRDTKMKKMLVKGSGIRDTLWRNWLVIGSRGVMTTHLMFEFGVTASLMTHRIKGATLTDIEIETMREKGFEHVFRLYAQQIARMNLYGHFIDHGWSSKLGKKTRGELAPLIVKAIALGWLNAIDISKQETDS